MTSNDKIIINMLNGINTRFDRLDEKVDTLSNRVDRLDEKVEKLSSRVDALDEKVDTLSSRVDALDEKVETLSNKVDGLSVRVGNLEQTTAYIQGELAGINGKIDIALWSFGIGFSLMTVFLGLMSYFFGAALFRNSKAQQEPPQKSGFTFSDLAALLQIALGRENHSSNNDGK